MRVPSGGLPETNVVLYEFARIVNDDDLAVQRGRKGVADWISSSGALEFFKWLVPFLFLHFFSLLTIC